MTNLELINEQYLAARKVQDVVTILCLGTMKGEIENLLKTSNKTADELITAYAIKSSKNLNEFKPANYERELEILSQFLPKQLSEEEVRVIVNNIKKQNKGVAAGKLMGIAMKQLKGADPKLVKKIIAE